jgi:hypothetical protein
MYRNSRRRGGRRSSGSRSGIRIPFLGRIRLGGWGFIAVGILVMVFITPIRTGIMKLFNKS